MTQTTTIPFSWTVNTRKLPMLHADLDEGLVMALRRPRSDFTAADFRLSGLDPAARYEVRDLDGGPAQQFDGATLMEAGLQVIINHRPGTAVRTYHRLVADAKPG